MPRQGQCNISCWGLLYKILVAYQKTFEKLFAMLLFVVLFFAVVLSTLCHWCFVYVDLPWMGLLFLQFWWCLWRYPQRFWSHFGRCNKIYSMARHWSRISLFGSFQFDLAFNSTSNWRKKAIFGSLRHFRKRWFLWCYFFKLWYIPCINFWMVWFGYIYCIKYISSNI